MVIFSVVLLHRTRAILTVWTVRIVFVPYRTVLVRYAWKVRSKPYKDGATVQYDFYRNLAVWLQFRPKIIFFFLQQVSMNKTQITNQESSTASDFEFPCNPLLGPSPELMQTQPSLWVVQGSIVWLRHIRGAHRGAKMGDLGVERPFWGHFCTGSVSLAPYQTPYSKLP